MFMRLIYIRCVTFYASVLQSLSSVAQVRARYYSGGDLLYIHPSRSSSGGTIQADTNGCGKVVRWEYLNNNNLNVLFLCVGEKKTHGPKRRNGFVLFTSHRSFRQKNIKQTILSTHRCTSRSRVHIYIFIRTVNIKRIDYSSE